MKSFSSVQKLCPFSYGTNSHHTFSQQENNSLKFELRKKTSHNHFLRTKSEVREICQGCSEERLGHWKDVGTGKGKNVCLSTAILLLRGNKNKLPQSPSILLPSTLQTAAQPAGTLWLRAGNRYPCRQAFESLFIFQKWRLADNNISSAWSQSTSWWPLQGDLDQQQRTWMTAFAAD